MYNVYIDGASRGNPGPASCAVIVKNDDGGIIHRSGRYLGEATNNQAEYNGLLDALRFLRDVGYPKARIHSDSELVVKQINGAYRVKNGGLYPLWLVAFDQISRAGNIEVVHVPRTENKEADAAAHHALDLREVH